jgi:hypothetical protein
VDFHPCASLNLHLDSLSAPTTGVTVTCLGVTLNPSLSPPVAAPPNEAIEQDGCCGGPDEICLFSPDYNNDLCVEGLDFTYVSTVWLSCDPCSRANFDRTCPGPGCVCVEGLDFAIFAMHWLHGSSCP